MRVDLGSGDVLQRQVGIRAEGAPACTRAGGAVLDKHGLWVIDKHRLWLLDPRRVGKSGAVRDHWALYRGTDAAKRIKGAYLLDSGGRLGIVQDGKKADRILMVRVGKLRKKASTTLVAQGASSPGEVAAKSTLTSRKGRRVR
jgi:hypothetical protein